MFYDMMPYLLFQAFLENVHKSIPKSGSTSSLASKLEEQLEHLHSDESIIPDLGAIMSPITVPMSPPPMDPLLDTSASEGNCEEVSCYSY